MIIASCFTYNIFKTDVLSCPVAWAVYVYRVQWIYSIYIVIAHIKYMYVENIFVLDLHIYKTNLRML